MSPPAVRPPYRSAPVFRFPPEAFRSGPAGSGYRTRTGVPSCQARMSSMICS